MTRTGATFADAAAEFLRHAEQDRDVKPSTLRDYRSTINAHMIPPLGAMRVEDVTTELIERWRADVPARKPGQTLSNRTKNKLLVVLHGIFERSREVYGLPTNPVADVERYRQRSSGDIEVFSVEEVHALVRAAEAELVARAFSLDRPPAPARA